MGTCASSTPEGQKKSKAVPDIAGGSHGETHGEPRTAQKGTAGHGDDLAFNAGAFVREQKGKITDFYNLQTSTLGSGAYGKVVKGVHKITGMMRAIKIIHKASASKEEQERLVNEVEILKQLDHPHIIKIFDFLQDDKDFYIACELCTGGELFDKIIEKKFFSEKMAADVLQQVLSAVHYCHTHKIVHRDLKPENILYESTKDNSQIKVIDFGTSRAFDPNEKMHQKFGTPYYIAPEILKKKYDQKCDVWSCGVIAYILLCGFPPFNGPNDKAIMEKVSKGLYTFEGTEWKAVSNDAKEFIRKLLEIDPLKRLTALEALNEPWLKKSSSSNQVDKPLMISAFNNLKTFRADRKLAEATWVFLVSVMASKEEKAELLKLFKALDKNNDGLLSREELLNGYKEYSKSKTPEEDIEAMMKAIDTNKSGVIDYSEFVMATIDRESLLSKQRLEAAFKMFDKDGNGLISKEELKDFFSSSNMKMEEEVWTNLIKEVDANGDGQVSFVEFKEMMIKMM